MVDVKRINLFLKPSSGDGRGGGYGFSSGSGDGVGGGYGSGSGSGYGASAGSGFGAGAGNGSGYGSGGGSSFGSGNGAVAGSGDGSCDGRGDGSSYCAGGGCVMFKNFNGKKVYIIDSIPCTFISIKKNIALIEVINKDLTTTKTFLAKDENFFAHGRTAKEAIEASYKKKIANMDVETKINLFVKTFDFNSIQSNRTFFDWHYTLTGSCELGRNRFVKENAIDLNKSMSTKKFLELTKNAYGGDIIKKIIEIYKQTNKG
jgi:hypothetical protein